MEWGNSATGAQWCTTIVWYPPPPLLKGGGASLHCFARQYLLWWFVFPICYTQVLALLSHYFESVTCVYSVIFSLKRQCTGCRVPFFGSKMLLPATMYGTTHAQQMGRSSATFGIHALVGSLKWIKLNICNSSK